MVYLGADHRGFNLKEILKKVFYGSGYEMVDLGSERYDESDDYPDVAYKVAYNVSVNPGNRGVLICGSGAGVDFTASKVKGVRSVLGIAAKQVLIARQDDDVNVLSLAADFTKEEEAKEMLEVFLKTPFSGEERHRRRLEKVSGVENLGR